MYNASRALLVAGLLLSIAGCDAPTAPSRASDGLRLQMAEAAQLEAQALYDRAVAFESQGETYRPLVLKAIVDGLQFGVPMTTVTVAVNGTATDLRAIGMQASATHGNRTVTEDFLFLWAPGGTGRLFVAYRTTGMDRSPGVLYTPGHDVPYMPPSGTTGQVFDFDVRSIGAACPYQSRTALSAPAASSCSDMALRYRLDLTAREQGRSSGAAVRFVADSWTDISGAKVTRATSSISPLRALLHEAEAQRLTIP